MRDWYAKCGNNCGRCALYAGNLTDEKREWCASGMARYINWRPKPENLRQCAGCQATKGFHYIKNCPVRLCAQHNDAENCAHCAVFPCPEVPTVSVSVDYRAQVADRLGSPIPEEDYQAFIEPYEGMKHLQEIRDSLGPEDIVEMKEVRPLSARLVRFPDGLALSEGQVVGFRALHQLMADVLTGRADRYVRQILLKKRRPLILTLLWVFGRYGGQTADGLQLVIDGEVHRSLADFAAIVRKRDNALHGAAAVSVGLLRDLDVRIEHEPLTKKTWRLRMSVGDDAGGDGMLKALKDYAGALVEAYGEPVYAGSGRYKGEAFGCFSKADMRVLSKGRCHRSTAQGQGAPRGRGGCRPPGARTREGRRRATRGGPIVN